MKRWSPRSGTQSVPWCIGIARNPQTRKGPAGPALVYTGRGRAAKASGLALPCVLLWCCRRGLAPGLAPGIPSLVRWLWGTEGWQGQGPPSPPRTVLAN